MASSNVKQNLARRAGIRAQERLPVLFAFREPDSKKRCILNGESINISPQGLTIALPNPLPRIDSGIIEIQLPHPWNPIKARCKITWWNDHAGHYGIQFCPVEGPPDDTLSRLSLFVNQSLSLLPDRRGPTTRRQASKDASALQNRKNVRRVTDCYHSGGKTPEKDLLVQTGLHPITRQDMPPRYGADFTHEAAACRRNWLTEKTGVPLEHLGQFSENPANMEGTIENLIGTAQVPIGLAGPLKINGEFARGVFYVPLATTEATLVYTYSQGMQLLSMADGVTTALLKDESHLSPLFVFDTVRSAQQFVLWLQSNFKRIAEEAHKTTRYGRLMRIEPHIFDRQVVVKFCYQTGDALGINIMTLATHAACKFITSITKPEKYYFQSNFSNLKKVSANHFSSGNGKMVIAEAIVPRRLIKRVYGVTPEAITEYVQRVLLVSKHAEMIGMNGHTANALAAVFIACGQDVANVVESHVSILHIETVSPGDLYISIKLPNLLVGTVGGGTTLGTQQECLSLLGCLGEGRAKKFAEIVAATILGGELSISAANAAGTFVNAFKKYRRKTLATLKASTAALPDKAMVLA